MSTNAVEKNAQALNQLLRRDGKKYGKAWRSRIRDLLSQTFSALNAKPLDGALCLRLSEQIEAELQAAETGEVDVTSGAPQPSPSSDSRMGAAHSESSSPIANSNRDDHEGETRMGTAHSVAGDACPAKSRETGDEPAQSEVPVPEPGAVQEPPPTPPEEIGLFDLIHVEIRCFFKIRACTRPPYIGRFVTFADRFAEVKQEHIDKFIGVLSNSEDEFSAKTEVEIGYREDLLPDMPERGLVLHPKKKNKH